MAITTELLKERQAWDLDKKVYETNHRLEQYISHWRMDGSQAYLSFSGGKDSTVLLHIMRNNALIQNTPVVFVDTGLEYPEIREFVKTVRDVVWLRPKLSFKQCVDKYGYPVISKEVSQKINEIVNTKSDALRNKRMCGDSKGNGKLPKKWQFLLKAPFKISSKCCDVLKKRPLKAYETQNKAHPIVATMACESRLRSQQYMKNGCVQVDGSRPMCTPMAFWTDTDVWAYIRKYEVAYATIYDKGEDRTGCMFCAMGQHLSDPNKFTRMKDTHPELYAYCMDTLGMEGVLSFCGIAH